MIYKIIIFEMSVKRVMNHKYMDLQGSQVVP